MALFRWFFYSQYPTKRPHHLVLRVSSLVRFYKSRFWFFSENFLKKIWNKISEKILKNLWIQRFSAASHSKMNENWLFCCCFQAVLLLFSNFLRCFSWILTSFRIFSIFFQNFFRIVSDFFQKFLKKIWKKIENFLKYFWKIYESRDFLLPTIQKWRKLAVLLLFSKFSASFSLLLAVLLLFSNLLRCFSRILTNFRNFSEILVRNISEINQIYPVPQQAGQKVSNLVIRRMTW